MATNYKSEELVWLEKKDFIKEFNKFYKVMYYLGALKIKRFKLSYLQGRYYKEEKDDKLPYQLYSGGNYRMLYTFRLWNPISWPIALLMFLVNFFKYGYEGIVDTVKAIKDGDEVIVSKPLLTLDGVNVFFPDKS